MVSGIGSTEINNNKLEKVMKPFCVVVPQTLL